MDANLRQVLKSLTLELRRVLEGAHDPQGVYRPGDLHRQLSEWKFDDNPPPAADIGPLSDQAQACREFARARIAGSMNGGGTRQQAIQNIVEDAARGWAIRLLALRCLESRGLLPVSPFDVEDEACHDSDPPGWRQVVEAGFEAFANRGLSLFAEDSAVLALRPSDAALEHCLAILAGTRTPRGSVAASADVFRPDTALGWAYQYWNTQQKNRVFARIGSSRDTKIQGSDLITATQVYTEEYMVRFLVQNSLGAMWIGMHPDSSLSDHWDYFVTDVDRRRVSAKPVREITLLDPACGTGHFLLEAFDLFYALYREEGRVTDPAEISRSILQRNLVGIDIDPHAIRIAEALLWIKAFEKANAIPPIPRGLATASDVSGGTRAALNRSDSDAGKASCANEPPAANLAPRPRVTPIGNLDELGSLARVQDIDSGTASRLRACLERQYDIVTANPPYMTSRHMGSELRDYLVRRHPNAWRDLYTAFMERCLQLTADGGVTAMVTQQSFLALSAYSDFRRQLLGANTLELAAHLGPGAFEAIPGQKVSTVLTLLRKGKPKHRRTTFLDARGFADKASALRKSCCPKFQQDLQDLLQIPGTPLLYDLEPALAAAFQTGRPLGSLVTITGSQNITADNARRLRFFWEVSGTDWLPYCKGGTYATYCEAQEYVVDFRVEAQRSYARKSTANLLRREQWDRPAGITYTDISSTQFAARRLTSRGPFDKSGPVLFPQPEHAWALLGILNSSVAHRILKALNPTLHVQVRDLKRLPIPEQALPAERLAKLARAAFRARRDLLSRDSTTRLFHPAASECGRGILDRLQRGLHQRWNLQLSFVLAKWAANREVARLYGVSAGGVPRMVAGYTELPGSIADEVRDALAALGEPEEAPLRMPAKEFIRVVSDTLRRPPRGERPRRESPPEPLRELPPEVPLEVLSRRSGIHPVSLYLCLRQHPQTGSALLRDELCNEISVSCLAGLGHRWPGMQDARVPPDAPREYPPVAPLLDQSDAERLSPEFAAMLLRGAEWLSGEVGRVTQADDEGDVKVLADWRRVCEKLLGESLDQWLGKAFFRDHTQRYKRRPVVWQLCSRRPTNRRMPAFTCLVHCQQVDAELLPRLRQRYAIPQRNACRRKLRALGSSKKDRGIATERRQLQQRCDELSRFERGLSEAIRRGFACDSLQEHAIEDALHCLSARWLNRLESQIFEDRLAAVLTLAAGSGIHRDLPVWIHRAFQGLQRSAGQCLPTVPATWIIRGPLPSPRALARAVCENGSAMIAAALTDANERWQRELQTQVLSPLRQTIEMLRREQAKPGQQDKEINSSSEASAEPLRAIDLIDTLDYELPDVGQAVPDDTRCCVRHSLTYTKSTGRLGSRRRELQAEVRRLRKSVSDATSVATQLRCEIEAWRFPETADWKDWLAEQPLFDQWSRLDEDGPPPRTLKEWIAMESEYRPQVEDGVRVNIAPLQRVGLLAGPVLAARDVERAIADRARWRADRRRQRRGTGVPGPP